MADHRLSLELPYFPLFSESTEAFAQALSADPSVPEDDPSPFMSPSHDHSSQQQHQEQQQHQHQQQEEEFHLQPADPSHQGLHSSHHQGLHSHQGQDKFAVQDHNHHLSHRQHQHQYLHQHQHHYQHQGDLHYQNHGGLHHELSPPEDHTLPQHQPFSFGHMQQQPLQIQQGVGRGRSDSEGQYEVTDLGYAELPNSPTPSPGTGTRKLWHTTYLSPIRPTRIVRSSSSLREDLFSTYMDHMFASFPAASPPANTRRPHVGTSEPVSSSSSSSSPVIGAGSAPATTEHDRRELKAMFGDKGVVHRALTRGTSTSSLSDHFNMPRWQDQNVDQPLSPSQFTFAPLSQEQPPLQFQQQQQQQQQHSPNRFRLQRSVSMGASSSPASSSMSPSPQVDPGKPAPPRSHQPTQAKAKYKTTVTATLEAGEEEGDMNSSGAEDAGMPPKRQFHVYSEQKRRALINEGFEDLRAALPMPEANKAGKSKLLSFAAHFITTLDHSNADLKARLAESKRHRTQKETQKEELKRRLLYAIGL